jgi:hypothetical protein
MPDRFEVTKLSNSRSIISTPKRELVGSLAKSNTANEKRLRAAALGRKTRRMVAIFRPFLETLRTIVWLQNGQPAVVEEVTTANGPQQPREKREVGNLTFDAGEPKGGERLSALPRSDN